MPGIPICLDSRAVLVRISFSVVRDLAWSNLIRPFFQLLHPLLPLRIAEFFPSVESTSRLILDYTYHFKMGELDEGHPLSIKFVHPSPRLLKAIAKNYCACSKKGFGAYLKKTSKVVIGYSDFQGLEEQDIMFQVEFGEAQGLLDLYQDTSFVSRAGTSHLQIADIILGLYQLRAYLPAVTFKQEISSFVIDRRQWSRWGPYENSLQVYSLPLRRLDNEMPMNGVEFVNGPCRHCCAYKSITRHGNRCDQICHRISM